MSKPIALVIGATGAQGGSVARALADAYHVRTVTRKPDSAAAKALAAAGVEVQEGDLAQREVVRAALAGAEVVFFVTQFWEHFSEDREFAEGVVFLDELAATPSVKKFVFSSLEDVATATGGKIAGVHHFNGKGRLSAYAKSKGIRAAYVHLAAYLENLLGFFTPQKQADGTYALTLPDMGATPYNTVSVADTGKFVRAIIDDYETYAGGKPVPLVSELISLQDTCAIISKELGITVKYNPVPVEVFASFGFPGAADLAGMFQFYRDYHGAECDRDPTTALKLYPGAATTATWVAAHKAALAAAWKIEA